MMRIRIAAALITDNRGRVLLVRKHGTAAFMQPGGKIEPGEEALDALRRELQEEIGVASPSAERIGRFTAVAANEPDRHVDADLFKVELSNDVTIGSEIAEFRWIDPAEPGEIVLAPLTKMHVLPVALSLRRRE
jgi:8-oxo-dGTP diphosphatase